MRIALIMQEPYRLLFVNLNFASWLVADPDTSKSRPMEASVAPPVSPRFPCIFDFICDIAAFPTVIHFCTKRDAPHNRWAYLYTDELLPFDTSGDARFPPDVESAFVNRMRDRGIQKRETDELSDFEGALSICA